MCFDDVKRQIERMDETLFFAYRGGGVVRTGRRRIPLSDQDSVLKYIEERNRYARSIGVTELGPHDYSTAAEKPTGVLADIAQLDRTILEIYSNLETQTDGQNVLKKAAGRLLGRRNILAANSNVPLKNAESYISEARTKRDLPYQINTDKGLKNFRRLREQVDSMDRSTLAFFRTGDGKLRRMTERERIEYLTQRNGVAATLGYPEETFEDFEAKIKAERMDPIDRRIRINPRGR